MPWGIAAPPETMVSWSARAIYKDGGSLIDILHDRHDLRDAYPADRQGRNLARNQGRKLLRWVQGTGMKLLKAQLKKQWVAARDDREVRIEQDGYVLVANPRASYGYLYVGAWSVSASITSTSSTG